MALLLQFLGLGLLLGGLAFGWWRWIRPHPELDFQGKGLVLLTILTMMGGFFGAPSWWADHPDAFSWDVPPLATRMLASAGWAFAVLCFLALQRITHRRLRLVMVLLAVYLVPLALAAVLFHLDRFDPAAPITYAFFAIVILMSVGSVWYLARPPRLLDDSVQAQITALPLTNMWLLILGVVMLAWGVALYVTDAGPSTLVWAWKGDLLSTRLIGTMLLAIGAGSLYARRYGDTSRIMLATLVTYGVGVAAAGLWNLTVGKPLPVSYVGVFGVIAAVSALLLIVERRDARAVAAGV